MVELFEVTYVAAPVERTFDLARSIEVHLRSNTHSGEQATAGTRRGLIGPGESVTWRARHLGVRQTLTSEITAWDDPVYFQDTMLQGAFQSMQHDHYFLQLPRLPDQPPVTEMRDVFRFAAPLGFLGRIAEGALLRRYMRDLLRERNQVIAEVAANGEWERYLPVQRSPEGDNESPTGEGPNVPGRSRV